MTTCTLAVELDAAIEARKETLKQRAAAALLADWQISVEQFDALDDDALVDAAMASGKPLAVALASRLERALDALKECE